MVNGLCAPAKIRVVGWLGTHSTLWLRIVKQPGAYGDIRR